MKPKLPMSTKKYLATLENVGLSRSGTATAAALGVQMRQCQRFADGTREVPDTVALLLAMYVEHGLPAWVREAADNALKAMQAGAARGLETQKRKAKSEQ